MSNKFHEEVIWTFMTSSQELSPNEGRGDGIGRIDGGLS